MAELPFEAFIGVMVKQQTTLLVLSMQLWPILMATSSFTRIRRTPPTTALTLQAPKPCHTMPGEIRKGLLPWFLMPFPIGASILLVSTSLACRLAP